MPLCVRSYALCRAIANNFNVYRSEKRARRKPTKWVRAGPGFRKKLVDDHRDILPDRAALLAACGPARERWARFVGYHIAWRDGDAATRAAVDASREADQQAWLAEGERLLAQAMGWGPGPDDKRYPASDDVGNETLMALADRLRALAVQNDPDAVRTALREIADALDQLSGREAPVLDEAAD